MYNKLNVEKRMVKFNYILRLNKMSVKNWSVIVRTKAKNRVSVKPSQVFLLLLPRLDLSKPAF